MPSRNVYAIAPHLPFLETLARGLLSRYGGRPETLAHALILLPSRRACRELRDVFVRLRGGAPLLLPRIRPLGDHQEEDFALQSAAAEMEEALPPPAIPRLKRQCLLASLIAAKLECSQDYALRLARDLASLLDEFQRERADIRDLKTLVPEGHALHWQRTVDFLSFLFEHWPRELASLGISDPEANRTALLERQAELWRKAPPQTPVIAAGSTGSIPASAALIRQISELPQGMVILPGLDRFMPEAAWEMLEESHHQFGLRHLLHTLGAAREEVEEWGITNHESGIAKAQARARFLSHAMLPVAATPGWRSSLPSPLAGCSSLPSPLAGEGRVGGPSSSQTSNVPASGTTPHPEWLKNDIRMSFFQPFSLPHKGGGSEREEGEKQPLQGLRYAECASAQEEARLVALLLREALEREGETAALVTHDRSLAQAVSAQMLRWGIRVDDSAGQPLSRTPPGVFLLLMAEAAASSFAPSPLLALLKHPLAAAGLTPAACRQRARELELAVLRGIRPEDGAEGLLSALRADGQTRSADFFTGIIACMKPLQEALAGRLDLASIAAAHQESALRLAASDNASGGERLWSGEQGEAVEAFFEQLRAHGGGLRVSSAAAYAAMLQELLGAEAFRPAYGAHPRLAILSPMEARLLHWDTLILGGMSEGVWPPAPSSGPWFSRPMRALAGLPSPERQIGLAAHDFFALACARNVTLTRSRKIEGAPSQPARWIARIEAVMAAGGMGEKDWSLDSKWKDWSDRLNRPACISPCAPPAPKPPAEARPRRISASRAGLLLCDPYAVYARDVLGLKALDPLDQDPGAADFGSLAHAFLERAALAWENLPEGKAAKRAQLQTMAEETFHTLLHRPAVRHFWRPRIAWITDWFMAFEAERRVLASSTHPELSGGMRMEGMELTAKADRIELLKTGGAAISDYKSGAPPRISRVALGFAPQLLIEALILEAGGFGGLPAAPVMELRYLSIKGRGAEGNGKPLKLDLALVLPQAREGLARLLRAFAQEETPYLSTPFPRYAPAISDYSHLARRKEWE